MPEPIRYEVKSDRDLLVMLAQSFNNLNEQTMKLCVDTENLRIQAQKNKEKLTEHELKLIEIVNANGYIVKETADTLRTVNALLNKHSDALSSLEIIRKFFWWIVGVIGAIVTATIIYMIQRNIYKGG